MATYFDVFLEAVRNCSNPQGILGEEYLVFPPSPDYGYASTPQNALTFGTMGVDGVHYAILLIDGKVSDDSPVITVSPMDSECYYMLGNSFLSYLAAACGVAERKMGELFEQEKRGKSVLIAFLKDNYNHSRLHDEKKRPKIENYLHLIGPKSIPD